MLVILQANPSNTVYIYIYINLLCNSINGRAEKKITNKTKWKYQRSKYNCKKQHRYIAMQLFLRHY